MYGRGGRRGGGYGRGRRGGGRGYDWTRHIPADHPIKRMGATWNTLSFEEKERAKAEYRANPERLARQEQRAAHRREADAATLEKMGEDPAQANAYRPTAMYVQVCATASALGLQTLRVDRIRYWSDEERARWKAQALLTKLHHRDPERLEIQPRALAQLERALAAARAAWPEQMASSGDVALVDSDAGVASAPGPVSLGAEVVAECGAASVPADDEVSSDEGTFVSVIDPPDNWDDDDDAANDCTCDASPPPATPTVHELGSVGAMPPREIASSPRTNAELPPAPPPEDFMPPHLSQAMFARSSAGLRDEHVARGENRHYLSMQRVREKLPAHECRAEIVRTVSCNSVVVVSGETGCGKTTQVPQFILDDAIERGISAGCNIVCTQPRRISAIGVAERVASERAQRLGDQCGYQVRLDRVASDNTQLLFCTTGILLRRLQNDPTLEGVSHVILDEVHERSIDSDFLLIILRDLLQSRRRDLRVVLMSATLNADAFAAFFQLPTRAPPPNMHIPGFTYPVDEYFLEDAVELTGILPEQLEGHMGPPKRQHRHRDSSRGGLNDESYPETFAVARQLQLDGYSEETAATVAGIEDEMLPLGLIVALVQHICRNEQEGAVLIFLPGWDDISKMHDLLEKLPEASELKLFPLHGSMPTAQQRDIFRPPPVGRRKVVIATNIAESSITIDDVVFVIDSGKHKEKTYDAENRIACLMPAWVSAASARQRRGRAGRVQAGKCWHLFTKAKLETLAPYQEPEIQRTPLEQLCLQVRALGVASPGPGGIEAFLRKALSPPSVRALANAIDVLRRISALSHETEELTTLGRHLATLPMDPRVGKALVFAVLLGCIEPVLTIVAILSHRSPFVMPLHKKNEADAAKQAFSQGLNSDHRAVLEAYTAWLREEKCGRGADFAHRNFLSGPALKTARDLREQLRSLLVDVDLLPLHDDPRQSNRHGHRWPVVVAALCAGFYPNVARADVGRGKFKKVKFFAREHGKLEPHPGSVNSSGRGEWRHRWVIYFDKVKTATGLYIYDSTEVGPLALLLFGAGDSWNEGRLLRCKPGGASLAPEEVAAAKRELTRCQERYGAMEDCADRELLGDRIETLEQQLAAPRGAERDGGASGDEAVDFVVRLLKANNGEYGMSRLSGFLKRSAPPHLAGQFFPIRRWLDAHGDVFVNEKRGGPWVVTLATPPAERRDEPMAVEGDDCVGVEDWIYFTTTPSTAAVVGGLRQAMSALLERRVLRLPVGRAADDLVDALCDALGGPHERSRREDERLAVAQASPGFGREHDRQMQATERPELKKMRGQNTPSRFVSRDQGRRPAGGSRWESTDRRSEGQWRRGTSRRDPHGQ